MNKRLIIITLLSGLVLNLKAQNKPVFIADDEMLCQLDTNTLKLNNKLYPRVPAGDLNIYGFDERDVPIYADSVYAYRLSLLESETAADVLTFMPSDVRPEVIQRIASLDTVQPSAMAELEAIMKQQFSKAASAQSSSFGGVMAAAKIMNNTKTELENSIMNGLNEIDPELMLQIQDNMFTFENLVSVDNKGIQVLMRNVEPDMLMLALKGASDAVKDRFFDNMSERARSMFKDDMEAKGPQRMVDVEDAQKKIMRIARKLSDSGELILGGADFV